MPPMCYTLFNNLLRFCYILPNRTAVRHRKTGNLTGPRSVGFSFDSPSRAHGLLGEAYFFINTLGMITHKLNSPMNAPAAAKISMNPYTPQPD